MSDRYDQIHIFSLGDLPDRGRRLDLDVMQAARQRLRIGLKPLPEDDGGPGAPPFLREHVTEGRASLVGPGRPAQAQELVVHGWSRSDAIRDALAGLTANHVTVLLRAPTETMFTVPARLAGQRVRVVDLTSLGTAGVPARLVPPPLSDLDDLPRPARIGVAWLTPPIANVMHELQDHLPGASVDVLDLSARPYRSLAGASGLADLGYCDLTTERLVRRLDVLLCYPPDDSLAAHDALIQWALSVGRTVLLPAHAAQRYGPAAIACPINDIVGHLAKVISSGGASPAHISRTRGDDRRLAVRPKRHQVTTKSVVFLTGKGGLGHLTRCMAIGRRLGTDIPVVVASQVPMLRAIEQMGFQAEFIASPPGQGPIPPEWDAWLGDDLDHLIETHNAGVLVYDGNHLTPSLVQAVASRRGTRLAWVRRGLWGRTTSRFLGNARWCDAILEPSEVAGLRDEGITAGRRSETMSVDPIRLLDPPDLLPRAQARAALGLDPARSVVLLQLGSRRSLRRLVDRLVTTLRRFPDLQVCLAGGNPPENDMGPQLELTYVNSFPLAQHYNAFDFAIAAAGYNTFLDVISFGLPTIFLPNRDPSLDDQAARARLAQDHAAGFHLDERDLPELGDVVGLMMNERARAYLRTNGLRLAPLNGAQTAADLVERLLHAEVA